jgi:16S rRNA (guanine527-N7)-methyltransferase
MGNYAVIEAYESYFPRPVESVAADLEIYAALLRKWQPVQNLVSRETLDALWTRHFTDSLQLLRHIRAEDRRILDLGSGGGFPALPLAIGAKGEDRHFTLVEPTSRKVSFLRTVARELSLPADVLGTRIEQIDSRETSNCDVITSRALASLPKLLAWSSPFFSPNTRALFHKGREHVDEIEESGASYDFDVLIHPSDTDPSGVILEISNLLEKSKR